MKASSGSASPPEPDVEVRQQPLSELRLDRQLAAGVGEGMRGTFDHLFKAERGKGSSGSVLCARPSSGRARCRAS